MCIVMYGSTQGNGYKLYVLEDLNGLGQDYGWGGTTGSFSIPGENETRREVVNFFAEKGLCVGSMYSYIKYKYTKEAEG